MKLKTVCVIGLGYIGLPTAAILAKNGYSVLGVDTDEEIVSKLNQGKIHIAETDLKSLVKSCIKTGQLRVSTKIQPSDIYIICVPTPFHKNKNLPRPNINYVLSATKSLVNYVKPNDLVILESTSPIGTTKKIQETLIGCGANLKDVYISYCPERVLPGKILKELVENDRIVGGITKLSTKKAKEFYNTFVTGNIIETDAKTAEMCKLTENSFRDLNVAFANELSILCDKQGINVWNLIALANQHPRVNILQPSTGVGGHCISVDPWFIISQDKKNSKLIHTARKVNNYKTKWVIEKIRNVATKHLSITGNKPKICCLGITFKPDVDDLRESRAYEVVNSLLDEGYHVMTVEPNIDSTENLELFDLSEAINESDIVCILVKHSEFLKPKIKNKLNKLGAIDFCGALI